MTRTRIDAPVAWKTAALLLIASVASARTAPVIERINPSSPCAGCVMQIVGRNMGNSPNVPLRVLFISGAVQVSADFFSGYDGIDDPTPLFIGSVPPEAPAGEYTVIVETAEGRSAPYRLDVREAVAPSISTIASDHPSPGEVIKVEGADFGTGLTFELTDAKGHIHTVSGWGHRDDATMMLPFEASVGEATMRVKNPRSRVQDFSAPLTFTILNQPPRPTLYADLMVSVAPGQWTDLRLDGSVAPLARSSHTDVEFTQDGHVYFGQALNPHITHIRVPTKLHPGAVGLRVRIRAGADVSEWSASGLYEVAPTPARAEIERIVFRDGDRNGQIRLEPDQKVTPTISVSPATEFQLWGFFPVVTAEDVHVTFRTEADTFVVSATDDVVTDDYAIGLRLPRKVPAGDGMFVVQIGAVTEYVPVIVHIQR